MTCVQQPVWCQSLGNPTHPTVAGAGAGVPGRSSPAIGWEILAHGPALQSVVSFIGGTRRSSRRAACPRALCAVDQPLLDWRGPAEASRGRGQHALPRVSRPPRVDTVSSIPSRRMSPHVWLLLVCFLDIPCLCVALRGWGYQEKGPVP